MSERVTPFRITMHTAWRNRRIGSPGLPAGRQRTTHVQLQAAATLRQMPPCARYVAACNKTPAVSHQGSARSASAMNARSSGKCNALAMRAASNAAPRAQGIQPARAGRCCAFVSNRRCPCCPAPRASIGIATPLCATDRYSRDARRVGLKTKSPRDAGTHIWHACQLYCAKSRAARQDVDVPHWKLHPLKGDPEGQWRYG